MISHNLTNPNVNYSYARDLAVENSDWERVIDSEGPYFDDGTMGPDDMFKLEFSGWKNYIEFKPKIELVEE